MLLLASIAAISLGLISWGAIRLIRRNETRNYDHRSKTGEVCAIAFSTTVLLITCFVHIGLYSSNLGMIGRLEASQAATMRNYEVTAERSIELLSDEDVKAALLAGSIEKLSLGTDVVARIVEHRDASVWFNRELAKLRAQSVNPWTSVAIPEIPEHLDYITIGEVD